MSKINFLNTEVKKLKTLLQTAFDTEVPEKTEGEDFDSLPKGKAGDVKIETFEIGSKVEIINGDGTLAAAPDGEYKHDATEDTYTVKAGFIDSINGEKAPKVEAETEAPVTDTWATEAAGLKAQMDSQAKDIADIKDLIASMQDSMSAQAVTDEIMSAQFSTQLSELNLALKTIAKLPVEDSKITNNNTVKDSKETKLRELAVLLGRQQ